MKDAVSRVGGHLDRRGWDRWCDQVVVDSRRATPGSLFVALPGTRTHGREFVPEAVAAGAMALLSGPPPARVDPASLWIHDDPLAALGDLGRWALAWSGARVVGVTGSVGKSATKAMLLAVLGRQFAVGGTPGNYNTAIGLPMALVAQPYPIDWFVAEMGMRGPGEILHLTSIARPQVAVITNIGYAHVGQLGSIEAIAAAKSEILLGMDRSGVAVLNQSDPRVRALAAKAPGRVVWYGGADADVEALDVAASPGGLAFTLRVEGQRVSVRMNWEGAHQAENAAAAAAVGFALGMTPDQLADGLANAPAAASHFRRVVVEGLTILDDTYNASPASVRAGLQVLQREPGRRVAVLADMMELGPLEEVLHREMGAMAAQCADAVWVVGERARWAADAAKAAGAPTEVFATVASLTEALTGWLQPGDVVYLKGSRAMGLEYLAARLTGGKS